MSDTDYKPIEEYKAVFDTLSPRLLKGVGEVAKNALEAFLLLVGDPDDFRTARELVANVASSVMLYLITEGIVVLDEAWLATIEEQTDKALKDAAHELHHEQMEAALRQYGADGTGGYA